MVVKTSISLCSQQKVYEWFDFKIIVYRLERRSLESLRQNSLCNAGNHIQDSVHKRVRQRERLYKIRRISRIDEVAKYSAWIGSQTFSADGDVSFVEGEWVHRLEKNHYIL